LNRFKPYLFLIELAIGLAIMVGINLIWLPGYPAFQGLQPHPYWLLVAPFAVYYGFREGMGAAVACAALFMLWTWRASAEPHWLLYFNFQRLINPILFMAGGLVLGELRERHRRRERQLKEHLEEVESALQDLSVNLLTLQEANQELEVRILSQDQTVQTLYQAAEGLKQLDEAAIYPALTDMLVDLMGVTTASVYLLKDDHFERGVTKGPITETQAPVLVPMSEGMMSGALVRREVTTIKMVLSKKELAGYEDRPILITAPLIIEGGQVVGMLNVHRLPFLRFTPATVRMVGLVADWGSIAIGNARKHKEVVDKNIGDELTGAYTKEYLDKRLKEEYSRATRYGMSLSLIMVRIYDYELITEDIKPDILSVLGAVFARSVRDSDMIFRYTGQNTFVLLLPATPLNGTQIVAGRIEKELAAFSFRPYADSDVLMDFGVGVAEVGLDMTGPQDLLDQAENDLKT